MGKADQLGAPTLDQVKEGRFTLARYVRCEASVAAPVTWTNIEGIQEITATPIAWGTTKQLFQQDITELREEQGTATKADARGAIISQNQEKALKTASARMEKRMQLCKPHTTE